MTRTGLSKTAMTLRRALPIFACLLLLGSLSALAQDEGQALPVTALIIATESGAHNFEVEFASTSDERRVGLMFRTEMADDHGMLFSYPQARVISMWMKNTTIPLDMIFIRRNGRIANIVENTTPHSEKSIVSQGKVIGVLELNAGIVERLGIKKGDLVRHEMFSNMRDLSQ